MMISQPIAFDGLVSIHEREVNDAHKQERTIFVGAEVPSGLRSLDDVVHACEGGLRRVVITPTIDFGVSSLSPQLGLVRDLGSCGVPVDWSLAGEEATDVSMLYSLPPPRNSTLPIETVQRWHEVHRFGLLYFRRGPGFLIVNDSRNGRTNEIRIRQGPLMQAFLACDRGVQTDLVPPAIAQLLLSEALVCLVGGNLVSLPHRMHHWPVPCNAV